MNLHPVDERIIVKPIEEEERKVGSLYIPDTASKERPQIGEVVAVGSGKLLDDGTVKPLEVRVGNRVLYGKYSGTEVTTKEGDEYLIMRTEDIFAVIE